MLSYNNNSHCNKPWTMFISWPMFINSKVFITIGYIVFSITNIHCKLYYNDQWLTAISSPGISANNICTSMFMHTCSIICKYKYHCHPLDHKHSNSIQMEHVSVYTYSYVPVLAYV